MGLLNQLTKFQFIEQMKTAADLMVGGCAYIVMLGQNVVILESSMRVVQMGQPFTFDVEYDIVKVEV